MTPLVPRALPWIAVCSLLLACNGEPAPQGNAPQAEPAPPPTVEPAPTAEPPKPPIAVVEPEPAAEPEPTAPEPAAPEPAAISARTAVLFRVTPKDRLTVWLLPEPTAADPAAARDLGILADDGGGAVDLGTAAPVISPDGRWIAYLDQGRLELARIDGTAKHRITTHKGDRVYVLISGFTPDSSALLFHQGEVQTEEGAALPAGVVEGFERLTLADLKVEPVSGLPGFRAFTDDEHVVFTRHLPDRSTELVRFDLDTGADELLQRSVDAFAFGQLVVHGDRLAYVLHADGGDPAAKKGSQVVVEGLHGEGRIEVTGRGGFAQYQWPKLSLDGLLVAFTDEKALKVVPIAGGATKTVATCVRRCRHAWDGSTTMLVLDEGQLSRVGLDGTTVLLATEVEGFAVAGEAG